MAKMHLKLNNVNFSQTSPPFSCRYHTSVAKLPHNHLDKIKKSNSMCIKNYNTCSYYKYVNHLIMYLKFPTM